METGDYHGATIQNNMARVMHGYLICGQVGEEHLILSAILAADLLAVHPGCVPPSCEEMCGTAPEAKTKRRNERHQRGRHQKAQHPFSTPLNNHIHVCCLIRNTMNALCFSVAALPQLPRWPPLVSHCLWLSGKRGAGIKKGLRYRRMRSSRKTWVPASRSMVFVTCGTRKTPCTNMQHLLFGFQRHTYNRTLRTRNTRNTHGTRSTKVKVEATAQYASHMKNGGNVQNGCFHDVWHVRKPPGTSKLYGFIFDEQKQFIPFCAWQTKEYFWFLLRDLRG